MAFTCIQFGQCGNQLGSELYSLLYSDIVIPYTGVSKYQNLHYTDDCIKKWFDEKENGKLYAKAILVDTEHKVLSKIKSDMMKKQKWLFDAKNMVCKGSGGAGNNWALGYSVKGREIVADVIDLMRIECEKADRMAGVIGLNSSAGGTGSGVSSYIMERLKEEYPNIVFLSVVVLPYSAGEVVTQNYNTLLTLTKLYDTCDAVFLFQNDLLHKMSTQLLKMRNIEFSDLNELLSRQIASVFQPTHQKHSLSDLISHVTPHPDYKLISIRSSPHVGNLSTKHECPQRWTTLIEHMKKTLRVSTDASWGSRPRGYPSQFKQQVGQSYHKSISNMIVSRGTFSDEAISIVDSEFKEHFLYPNWIPQESVFLGCNNNRRFLEMDKFICMATNNSCVHVCLNDIIDKSWASFIHSAYVHQYSKYSVSKDDFTDSFCKMESITQRYKEL